MRRDMKEANVCLRTYPLSPRMIYLKSTCIKARHRQRDEGAEEMMRVITSPRMEYEYNTRSNAANRKHAVGQRTYLFTMSHCL